MPSIAIQEAFIAVSAASATGVLTVPSNDYLFPGALAWVCKDNGSAQARVRILACIGSTQVQVRRFPNDNENSPLAFGVSDMTAFNGASHICQEAQTAPVDPAYSKRVVP
jgi:hypothetical protein